MSLKALLNKIVSGAGGDGSDSANMDDKNVMEATWDGYARCNAAFYIATEGKPLDEEFQWDMEKFFSQGREELLGILRRFGFSPESLGDSRVVEIGCGIGRQTHALAELASSVVACDISEEMLRQAKEHLAGIDNVEFFKSSGSDLAPVESNSVDLVYSFVVFQHITDKGLTRSYFAEASRVLKLGARFLFQVKDLGGASKSPDVWHGSDISEKDIRGWSADLGFRIDHMFGHKTHYLWACLTKV